VEACKDAKQHRAEGLQAFSAAAMIGKIEAIGLPIFPALTRKGHIRGRTAGKFLDGTHLLLSYLGAADSCDSCVSPVDVSSAAGRRHGNDRNVQVRC
jgi:hypothetical protein